MSVLYTLLGLAILAVPVGVWHLLARLFKFAVDRSWKFEDVGEIILAHAIVLIGLALTTGLLIVCNNLGYWAAARWHL